MKCSHALGFLTLGFAMSLLPQVLPASFAPGLIGTTGARDTWVALMSWVQIGIGAGELTRRMLRGVGRILRYDPAARSRVVRPWRPVVKRPVAPVLMAARPVPPAAFPLALTGDRTAA
jgi:hypothetical protein